MNTLDSTLKPTEWTSRPWAPGSSSSQGMGVFHEFPPGGLVPGVADTKLLRVDGSYKHVGGQYFVSTCTLEPSLAITSSSLRKGPGQGTSALCSTAHLPGIPESQPSPDLRALGASSGRASPLTLWTKLTHVGGHVCVLGSQHRI